MVDGEKERKSVNMSMFAFLAADGRPAQSGIVNQRVLSHEEAERAAHLREGKTADATDADGPAGAPPHAPTVLSVVLNLRVPPAMVVPLDE